MTTSIEIADGLTLPADAATQVFAFLGRRGAGKTYAAGRLVEQLLDHSQQVIILDPVGNWWGLRLARDGKHPGIAIPVFGGLHGDLPLQPTAGKVIAEVAASQRHSMVLDISDFDTDMDQRRFVWEFCATFFKFKKKHPSPVMIVYEEAQEIIPQHVTGDVARMVGAVLRQLKLGRNFGIGGAILSQRPQSVNKNGLNLAEILFAFQLTGPQERKTIADWVKEKEAEGRETIANDLPSLPIGDAFAWSPQWLQIFGRYRILPKRTFDASATPKADQVGVAHQLRPLDLNAIEVAMAASLEEAKANDPTALRNEVARLKRELSTARSAQPPTPVTKTKILEQPVIGKRDLRRIELAAGEIAVAVDIFRSAFANIGQLEERASMIAKIVTHLNRFVSEARSERLLSPVQDGSRKGSNGSDSKPIADPISPGTHRSRANVSLSSAITDLTFGEDRVPAKAVEMLVALASRQQMVMSTSRDQLATLTMQSRTSGGYATHLANLRRLGLLGGDRGLIIITDAGLEFLGPLAATKPRTAIEIQSDWLGKLKPKAAEMLQHILSGTRPTREELAQVTHQSETSGGYATHLATLNLHRLIRKGSDRRYDPSPDLL